MLWDKNTKRGRRDKEAAEESNRWKNFDMLATCITRQTQNIERYIAHP